MLIGRWQGILEAMAAAALRIRPLARTPDDAVRLAIAAGAHGIYVHNALARGEGDGFVFRGVGDELGLCWFGPRGNLVIVGGAAKDAVAVAEQIQLARLPWRIAMGPGAVIDAIGARCAGRPLVHRDQIYYRGDATVVDRARVSADARRAERGDRDRLLQATLQLNQADLHIEPRRVDRRWLYDTIDERIAAGSTWVSGPGGAIDCKLDIGSDGPAGRIIEGVFTFPAARGRGLAAALVRACLLASTERAALHVGADNVAALRAYERAGMTAVDRCRLLLLG